MEAKMSIIDEYGLPLYDSVFSNYICNHSKLLMTDHDKHAHPSTLEMFLMLRVSNEEGNKRASGKES
jgi:hypothetical protein